MLHEGKPESGTHIEINPYVDQLASRLMDVAGKAELKFDSTGWELITEVLSYAASAEQRLSEQQDRISYLEQLSITDELTGITNRRGLRLLLAQCLADAARHRETGVLGFIDLDGFKALNDTLGHAAGDAALRHIAKLLNKHTRTSDVAARIAGDEFAVLLPRCAPDQGIHRLKALQEIIDNSTFEMDGMTVALHCSMGVARYKGGMDPATLIRQADQAMYADKAARRDAA